MVAISAFIFLGYMRVFSSDNFNTNFKILFFIFVTPFLFAFILLIKNTYIVPEYHYSQQNIDLELPIEKIILFSEDNIMISSWILKYHSNSPTIILSHGLGGSKLDNLDIAKKLYKNGYNCLLFDFRAHGESSGKITSFGYREQKDLKTVIDYVLNSPSFNNKQLGLYGISMGGAVSILVSRKYDGVKVLVVDSSFTTLQSALERHSKLMYHIPGWIARYPFRSVYVLRFFKDPVKISCLEEVKKFDKKAIFFINGENDIKTPKRYAKELYDEANEPKKLWIIPTAGHLDGFYQVNEAYIDKVIDFFNKYLPRKPIWVDE